MSIYPDKKDGVVTGRWRVEVQLGTLRKRGRFNNHVDAKAAEKQWQLELARGEVAGTTKRGGNPERLSELLSKAVPLIWEPGSDHGALSEKKVQWIINACGDTRLSNIPGEYVDTAIAKLRSAGKAPGTINRYLSALHKVLDWGAKPSRRYVPVMPEFQWQDEDEGRIRWLTPDEERRLIATLQALGYAEIADLCIAAIDTGCRRGELLAAQRDQLDGKWLRLWQTKNGAPRSVPLTERTQAILAERLPWTVKEHQIRYAWEKAKVAMGLSRDEDFVFHTLRHTRATRLVELGVNLRVIQQFMGHKAIQTTIRYAHVSNEMLVDAVSRMERLHPTNPVGDVLPRADTPPNRSSDLPLHRAVLEPVQ